jgi:hypothetical protein
LTATFAGLRHLRSAISAALVRATPNGENRNLVTVVEAKTQGERLRRIWPEAETDADARELDRLFEIAIEQGYEVGQRARNRALYLKQLSDDAMA